MKSTICPAECHDCECDIISHEMEHTVVVRGDPDQTMCFTKKGYFCKTKSFFFCLDDFLSHEEKLINTFAGTKYNNPLS